MIQITQTYSPKFYPSLSEKLTFASVKMSYTSENCRSLTKTVSFSSNILVLQGIMEERK